MFLFWIIIIVFNLQNIIIAQDVQLSIENSTKTEYVGYLWANSKFVFLTPYLRATALKGKSVSEKICGFELTSSELRSVPFMVYLVDEVSGLGEMQVKPDIDLEHQKDAVMKLTVEAYDCDTLPHYSNRVNVVVHISKLYGPSFNQNAYSFVVQKNSNIGTVVGKVDAVGSRGGDVKYAFYHAGRLPFSVDNTGTIRTMSSLEPVKDSLILLRVVATELSKPLPTQSIIAITIEIKPICTNKLNGIPDQLDYKIKGSAGGIMSSERLIQDKHQPHLIICDLPSPFLNLTLDVSLIHLQESSGLSDTNKLCYTDIASNRLQRRVCNVHPGTVDLFLTQGGIINLNGGTKSIDPEVIPSLKEEFSLTWWMKRETKERLSIFCFQNEGREQMMSLSIVDCTLLISLPGTTEVIVIPDSVCLLNHWIFYSISRQWRLKTTITVTVADRILTPIPIRDNILQQDHIRFYVGQCPSSDGNRPVQSRDKNQLQIGVISLSKEASLFADSVSCMSTCGETLRISPESMKKLYQINFERRGSSLRFVSSSIPEIIKIFPMIKYSNSYYWNAWKYTSERVTTHVAIDLLVRCKKGETISIPRTVIKVNVVPPQREPANDTVEVDIYASSTVHAIRPQSIRLFPDFRFVNSITEEPIKRDLLIEGCTIRPLQRNFVVNENIYLARLVIPIIMESNLKIKYDSGSWNIDGEGTAELYERLLRHVTFDMVNERRKLFIFCVLKSGDFTNQAFVDVISPKKNKITIINDDHSMDVDQYAQNGLKRINEQEDQVSKDHFDITKSKFIAIVIMAVVGGATMSIVSVAIACFVMRRRGNLMSRNRIKLNDVKSYQREMSPTLPSEPQSGRNPLSGCIDYEFDDDRVSMADIPDADEHSLDNVSCDTCNMTDPEACFNNNTGGCTVKDIPRSKTINFPIIHKRF